MGVGSEEWGAGRGAIQVAFNLKLGFQLGPLTFCSHRTHPLMAGNGPSFSRLFCLVSQHVLSLTLHPKAMKLCEQLTGQPGPACHNLLGLCAPATYGSES